MQQEYLVYTTVANLQQELRAELKQIVKLLEEIRNALVEPREASTVTLEPAPPQASEVLKSEAS